MSAAAKKKPAAKRRAKKRDLVLGLGRTGLSVARYLARNGGKAIFVDTRENPPGLEELGEIAGDAEIILGELPARILKGVARIIASPGVSDAEPFLVAAREAKIDVVSDIELFVHDADAPIVAVTGSNGKSTVTTLLGLMCDAAERTGLAGANLGVPALDLLLEETPDFYILELSSFQLQRTRHLPAAVAVLLNISPDHLDWHGSEAEYREAKYRIFREAQAVVWNRADDEMAKRLPKGIPALSFGLDEPGKNEYGLLADASDTFLARGEQLLLAVSEIALVGTHNYANALAALAAGQLMGLGVSPMLQVLHEFPGLPHRMQFVADCRGIRYINDSKATNVGAAIASVDSVRGAVVLIAGGVGKGGDFDRLANATAGHLRAAVLIGEDAPLLEASFAGVTPTERASDMRTAVARAAELAETGDTVLLAPACASFDLYPDYRARGEHFTRLVEALTI
ncbi:MAG: UDP-N-acetylmuramoyl-L-alanine--D-glutamate ligase [Gammaproteobacteria bacterium]|nr:UDP-N-acetylmuramoyl-L-alanine--D-glutamate ligase [Gammaproteobacteria bacterium]MDH5344873.1 UDP-N-acetylmuramoyl-L-alanine--D-glutamate ligase [Gammaproteobacteria bacterium]